jgi:cell division protein FtsQ
MSVQTRFMRPLDFRATRRNHRKVQVQRILWIAANVVFVFTVAVAGYWLYERTQRDRRFSIGKFDVVGAKYTSAEALQKITSRYAGLNLFRLDVETLRKEIESLAWVERAEIEKQIPHTVVVRIVERRPVALLHGGGIPRYVDGSGRPFALLTPAVGDKDLPLISVGSPSGVSTAAAFLQTLRRNDPALYSRVSEIQPLVPDGFRLFDRELKTWVTVDADGSTAKWLALYAIARKEGLAPESIEYADLRFDRRIVVKTKNAGAIAQMKPATVTAAITN